MPFIILALPRSRTAWLSRFLSYGDWTCGHEQLRHCRSLDDVKAWFSQPCTGTAETAAAPFWRLLPDVKIVTVRRPVSEVVDSLMGVGQFDRELLTAEMVKLDRKLDQIEARRDCLSVKFADLETEAACKAVFEHCLPYAHDHAYWEALAPVNVQIDLKALFRYYAAYKPALDKLARVAKHRQLADMAVKPVCSEALTIQSEAFDTWLADAAPLFNEHLCQVGEAPDDWRHKNIPLMRLLYEGGAMQITTARSNGRLFGYLMTLIAPSLESEGVTTGTNTTFFASADYPGLGLKLQRASLRFLQERGVNEVFWQARHRGAGERAGAIYRRLGAENDGQVYRLHLEAA